MEERTLILIKPEGVQQGLLAEINSRLTQRGLRQATVKTVQDIDDIKKKWDDLHRHTSELDKIQQGLLAEINSRLAKSTQTGLKQVAVKTVQDIDDSLKKKWNAQHSSVLDKIDSGPVIALVYQGLHAVNEARIELGDINVKDAFFRSENQETAEQEIALWFEEKDVAHSRSMNSNP